MGNYGSEPQMVSSSPKNNRGYQRATTITLIILMPGLITHNIYKLLPVCLANVLTYCALRACSRNTIFKGKEADAEKQALSGKQWLPNQNLNTLSVHTVIEKICLRVGSLNMVGRYFTLILILLTMSIIFFGKMALWMLEKRGRKLCSRVAWIQSYAASNQLQDLRSSSPRQTYDRLLTSRTINKTLCCFILLNLW